MRVRDSHDEKLENTANTANINFGKRKFHAISCKDDANRFQHGSPVGIADEGSRVDEW